MRIVREVAHPECKITFFSWNNRYLIKLEQGLLEQTYKVNQFDVTDEEDLIKIVDSEFLQDALSRFGEMFTSLSRARQRTAN
jgi:hypothetical protein